MSDRSQRPNERPEDRPTRPGRGRAAREFDGEPSEDAGPPSARRTADPWLPAKEPYAGAAALDDLAGAAGDAAATRRVLARYAAVRLVRRAAAGILDDDRLAYERRIATGYAAAVGRPSDAERRALARTIGLADQTDSAVLWAALTDAATLAERSGAARGAYILRRTIFELASRASCAERAADAAAAVVRLAEANDASRRAIRWWRRAPHAQSRQR